MKNRPELHTDEVRIECYACGAIYDQELDRENFYPRRHPPCCGVCGSREYAVTYRVSESRNCGPLQG